MASNGNMTARRISPSQSTFSDVVMVIFYCFVALGGIINSSNLGGSSSAAVVVAAFSPSLSTTTRGVPPAWTAFQHLSTSSRVTTRIFMSDSDDGGGSIGSTGKKKDMSVTVVGGTGFVGSRVCKLLVEQGNVQVTSLSKTGRIPQWCASDSWTSQVTWKSIDVLSSSESELDVAMGTPTAVISCVGVIGTDPDVLYKGNGQTNINVFSSAKRAGTVNAVVLVSVSSEVTACQENWLPEFFKEYFNGKLAAEQAAKDVGASSVTIVRPTFIYGGDSFGLLPPRVNDAYGSFIDQLLSFVLFDALANVTPGLIKVALRPPVSVNAVAGACVAGVLSGASTGVQVLDTAADINNASNQPAATGVQDAIEWVIEQTGKAVDFVQKKIQEQQDKKFEP